MNGWPYLKTKTEFFALFLLISGPCLSLIIGLRLFIELWGYTTTIYLKC